MRYAIRFGRIFAARTFLVYMSVCVCMCAVAYCLLCFIFQLYVCLLSNNIANSYQSIQKGEIIMINDKT